MSRLRASIAALTLAGSITALPTLALAAPVNARPAPVIMAQAKPPVAAHPHASLRVDVAPGDVWVGQAVPITVRATFRDVEGATLQGNPQITSKSVLTSDLIGQPRQSNEVRDGVPMLTVTWTGTITPSSPGPVDLTVTLPVQTRYREAVARPDLRSLFGDDPFSGFPPGLFDTSMFDHAFEQAAGAVHEEHVDLKAQSRELRVLELPAEGRPASFTGAVGQFGLNASVSSTDAHVAEPLTLRITVEGQGDLDRVELAGVAGSDMWKAYPPEATIEPATAKKRGTRKIFEQVLVPLRAGEATIPAVSLSAFDPKSGHYVTRETSPLTLAVAGAPAGTEQASSTPTPAAPEASTDRATPAADWLRDAPWKPIVSVAAPLSGLTALAAAFAFVRRRKSAERALRRAMREAAAMGVGATFFDASRRLIETKLAGRWGVRPDEVNARVVRERLGAEGDALATVLDASEALRFARGGCEGNTDLDGLRALVERTLRRVA